MGFFKPNVEKLIARKDIQGLIQAAQHKNEQISQKALDAIRGLSDAGDVDLLIGTLKSDLLPLRLAAAEALGRIGDSKAFAPLVHAAWKEKERPQLLFKALEGLKPPDHMKQMVALLLDQAWPIYRWTGKKVVEIGAPAVPLILQNIGRSDLSEVQFSNAINALKQIGPPALADFADWVRKKLPEVRARVIKRLVRMGKAAPFLKRGAGGSEHGRA
ncbi:MAG: HEAT repeat domain-containing protein [Proteobacteria bacterium]|nr:HEAT repeat domain-containing protein [Pseudomonadota bacterium]